MKRALLLVGVAALGGTAFGILRLGHGPLTGSVAGNGFERLGATLDDPARIFAAANYRPVWTASQAEAAGRLPKGLKVMPQQARLWEPWFRDSVTIGGKRAGTAARLELKAAVASAAAQDPALAFQAPLNPASLVVQALAVESRVLKEKGVSPQDSVARQISRLDMAASWVCSRRHYGKETGRKFSDAENKARKYLTLKELLSTQLSITCGYATTSMIYMVREMEKVSPTGVSVGGLYVFRFREDGKQGLHAVVGATISLPNGKRALAYYDPTPTGNKVPTVYDVVTRFGPADQVTLERFANLNSIAVLPGDIRMVGAKLTVVAYDYPLGENWGARYGIGNYDASVVPSYGVYSGGYDDYRKGAESFKTYKTNNQGPVDLENVLTRELRNF